MLLIGVGNKPNPLEIVGCFFGFFFNAVLPFELFQPKHSWVLLYYRVLYMLVVLAMADAL